MRELFFHPSTPLSEMFGRLRERTIAELTARGVAFWSSCKNRSHDGQCLGHIRGVAIERNEDGSYLHPDLPDFANSDDTIEAWIIRQGLEIDIQHANWNGHNVRSLHEWTPTPPDRKGNWFLLVLIDTDDGPVAWWANPIF